MRPRFFRLTFWPRFYNSRNYLRNRVEKKDIGLSSTYLCTEFRCGSCSDSHFSWRCYICKFRLEVLETPKTTHFVHFSELTCSKIPGMLFLPKKSACGRLTGHTKLIISRKCIFWLFKYFKAAICLILASNTPPTPPHAGGGMGWGGWGI